MYFKYILLFVVIGCLSSCQFFSQKNSEIVSFDVPLGELPETAFSDSLELDKKYINNFRLDGFREQGEESTYLVEKKKLIDTYMSGNRTLNILRSYLYLMSLEGNFAQRDILEKEYCTLHALFCRASLTRVSVSGIVTDEFSKPLSGSVVTVLGKNISTTTDVDGRYKLSFDALSPAVYRLQVSYKNSMIAGTKIELSDALRLTHPSQNFERDFTLSSSVVATYEIDIAKKQISGSGSKATQAGFEITTPYTKYVIPYDAIVKNDIPYKGKLRVSVFDFNRETAGAILESDAFDAIEGFATSLLVTYGMPFIIFIAEDGTHLDVLDTRPMLVATTLRERDDFMKTSNFDILYKMAYDESRRQPDKYPIDASWLYVNGNLRIIPPFWVFDRETGYWNNQGFRFVTTNPESPYNIEAPFYTKKAHL